MSLAVVTLCAAQVLGGTVNCGDSTLEIRATAVAADSTVARMATLVEQVQPSSPTLDQTDPVMGFKLQQLQQCTHVFPIKVFFGPRP